MYIRVEIKLFVVKTASASICQWMRKRWVFSWLFIYENMLRLVKRIVNGPTPKMRSALPYAHTHTQAHARTTITSGRTHARTHQHPRSSELLVPNACKLCHLWRYPSWMLRINSQIVDNPCTYTVSHSLLTPYTLRRTGARALATLSTNRTTISLRKMRA